MSESQTAERTESIGQFVRAHRKLNRMTQVELAEAAGVGLRFLKELEHDKPTLRMDRVNAVLHLFGKRLGLEDRPRGLRQQAPRA
ncbi:MAG: transcriptional regulator [Chloroflexota bacterium]